LLKQKIPFRYTKTEQEELLKSMIVLMDTREKKNNYILNYFDDKDINYKSKKLDFGDYSMMIPANENLGIMRDIYFTDDISCERKNSLEELSGNFTRGRSQFENELIRSNGAGARMILMVEDGQGYEKIINGKYDTDYNNKSFIGTLQAFRARYGIDINFINPKYSGNFMYYTFYYYLREYLK